MTENKHTVKIYFPESAPYQHSKFIVVEIDGANITNMVRDMSVSFDSGVPVVSLGLVIRPGTALTLPAGMDAFVLPARTVRWRTFLRRVYRELVLLFLREPTP